MSMMTVNSVQFYVEIDGMPMDPVAKRYLVEAEIDSSLYLPDQARLVFQAVPAIVLPAAAVSIGSTLTIQVETKELPSMLFMGEVTAVELEYTPEGVRTVVRGLDRSHRLMKGTSTRAMPDMTSSDAVALILGEAGVPPGEIMPTTTIYPQLNQGNVSDWVFIQQLADLEGYDAYMSSDGLFNFKPVALAEEAPPPIVSYEEPSVSGAQLVVGRNVTRLKASVTGADQVSDVMVRGWDPVVGIPVVGDAPAMTTAVQSEDPEVEAEVMADLFGGATLVLTDRAYASEAAAETRARAVASRIAASSIEMYGECYGSPTLVAGTSVSLGMAGLPFDGVYVLSEAKHRFVPGTTGYTTWFTIGGRRDRSLLALANPGGSGSGSALRPTIPGIVTAKVVDCTDDEGLGRVRLSFPWLDSEYVSDYARVRQDHVSEGSGCLWVPEVNTEVLVAFDRGDFNSPYVLGCLYSGTVPPEPTPDIDGVVNERRIQSRMRHMIQFLDGAEQGIKIMSGEQDCTIFINADDQSIQITSAGMISITAEAEMSLSATGDLSISTEGALSLEGTSVSISGTSVEVAGEGDVSIEAGEVSVTAGAIMLGEG